MPIVYIVTIALERLRNHFVEQETLKNQAMSTHKLPQKKNLHTYHYLASIKEREKKTKNTEPKIIKKLKRENNNNT